MTSGILRRMLEQQGDRGVILLEMEVVTDFFSPYCNVHPSERDYRKKDVVRGLVQSSKGDLKASLQSIVRKVWD